MRIGIEGLPLLYHRTGTSTYAHELVQNLRQLRMGDTVSLFARPQRQGGGSYHRISPTERIANLYYKEHTLPAELAARSIDIYHAPRDMGLPDPRRLPCPGVMTLHDIILVRMAQDYYSPARGRLYRRRLLKRLSHASHVITVSEFSKHDILDFSEIDPSRVSVVHNGVSEQFQPVTEEKKLDEARQRYQLARRFILCIGSTEPRKNVRRAIAAFSQLRRTEPGLRLVVTGVDYARIRPDEAFGGLGLEGVHFAGYIADADMPALYSLAEALLFPSLYEGFGLPPLEAMACGTPVITSSTTSLPEIAGDASILVNPESTADIAGALGMLLDSESLRRELIEKGKARAATFSWRKTAEETRKIYEKVLGK